VAQAEQRIATAKTDAVEQCTFSLVNKYGEGRIDPVSADQIYKADIIKAEDPSLDGQTYGDEVDAYMNIDQDGWVQVLFKDNGTLTRPKRDAINFTASYFTGPKDPATETFYGDPADAPTMHVKANRMFKELDGCIRNALHLVVK